MKPDENMEQFVRDAKPHVTTGESMDRRVLSDSFAAMDERLAAVRPGPPTKILASRIMRFAAAAVIIIAMVGLLIVYKCPRQQVANQKVLKIAKSPAEMLTAWSLMTAYRHGGIEALDNQCDKAFEMSGQQRDTLNMKELLAEIEIDLERTEL